MASGNEKFQFEVAADQVDLQMSSSSAVAPETFSLIDFNESTFCCGGESEAGRLEMQNLGAQVEADLAELGEIQAGANGVLQSKGNTALSEVLTQVEDSMAREQTFPFGISATPLLASRSTGRLLADDDPSLETIPLNSPAATIELTNHSSVGEFAG